MLTTREKEIITRIGTTDYNEDDPASPTWTHVICENRSDNAVFGSLIKKGLVYSTGSTKDDTCWLTIDGLREFRYINPDHWYTKKCLEQDKEQELSERRLPNC